MLGAVSCSCEPSCSALREVSSYASRWIQGRRNIGPLAAVGYDPSLAPERVQVTTGSGVEFVPLIAISELKALGHTRAGFPVLGHTLPQSASVDGLLGLDFLRGQELNIDFRRGLITLG